MSHVARTVTDRQGREWECSFEHGVIVARRRGRAQVLRDKVGFHELPPEDELGELLRTYTWGRGITDAEGTR